MVAVRAGLWLVVAMQSVWWLLVGSAFKIIELWGGLSWQGFRGRMWPLRVQDIFRDAWSVRSVLTALYTPGRGRLLCASVEICAQLAPVFWRHDINDLRGGNALAKIENNQEKTATGLPVANGAGWLLLAFNITKEIGGKPYHAPCTPSSECPGALPLVDLIVAHVPKPPQPRGLAP